MINQKSRSELTEELAIAEALPLALPLKVALAFAMGGSAARAIAKDRKRKGQIAELEKGYVYIY